LFINIYIEVVLNANMLYAIKYLLTHSLTDLLTYLII